MGLKKKQVGENKEPNHTRCQRNTLSLQGRPFEAFAVEYVEVDKNTQNFDGVHEIIKYHKEW